MKPFNFFWILLVSLASLLVAQQPDLGSEAQRESGKVLYNLKCAQCHGGNGDGQGIATAYFNPRPRDFTSGQFKIRTTENGELPTDDDLKKIIRDGMPYTGMPAWPDLSGTEIEDLVYYIKTFSEDFSDPDYLPKAMEFPPAPSFSSGSAQKGRVVFENNDCIKCHGALGRGDGPSAKTLVDDADNHLKPADMTKRWTFRGGGSREDIYRTFTTGMNGTPMPSYHGLISLEEQWQLVDYVYSLSKDEPDYGILIIAKAVSRDLDIEQDSTLFDGLEAKLFPIFGQIIEPGREFYPGVNAISAMAVYNTNEIAIKLEWNDMSAEQEGENSPDLEAPLFGSEEESSDDFDDDWDDEVSSEEFSDAVAIQFPAKMPQGNVKPFFLFGDSKNAVSLWFTDLAKGSPELFTGRGSKNLTKEETGDLSVLSNYENGQWTVIFKQKRQMKNGLSFDEGTFVPIAFSVWDGFNKERGNKRGISSWYNLYLEPMEKESVIGPMFKWGFITLLLELGLVFGIRSKYKKEKAASE